MNLVEQVARAICESTDGPWEFHNKDGHAASFVQARAAIATVLAAVGAHLSAVQYDPAPYTALKARLAKVREECEADRTPPQAPPA